MPAGIPPLDPRAIEARRAVRELAAELVPGIRGMTVMGSPDPRVAREIFEGLAALRPEFPKTYSGLDLIVNAPPAELETLSPSVARHIYRPAGAAGDPFSHIWFYEDLFKPHPPAQGGINLSRGRPRLTAQHEFGHALHSRLGVFDPEGGKKWYEQFERALTADARAREKYGYRHGGAALLRSAEHFPSAYAMYTPQEAFAESFLANRPGFRGEFPIIPRGGPWSGAERMQQPLLARRAEQWLEGARAKGFRGAIRPGTALKGAGLAGLGLLGLQLLRDRE